MLDLNFHTPTPNMQRVRGKARVVYGKNGLKDLHQSGAGKAMLPRVHTGVPEVVFLNTAGGLTSGDQLELSLTVEADCHVIATTQTAERAYATPQNGGDAKVNVRLRAGAGATLEWLPQETILFENSRLKRHTRADIAHDSSYLSVESVILGRKAMGEELHHLAFQDRRETWRADRLEHLEPLEINATLLAERDHAVTLAGSRALASLAFFAQGAQDLVNPLKNIPHDGVCVGVSGWDGKLIIRARAQDGFELRQYLGRVLEQIKGTPLPRVWQL